MDLTAKKIVVTGGAGFLGQHVVARLQSTRCKKIFVPRSREFDLTRPEDCARLLRQERLAMRARIRIGAQARVVQQQAEHRHRRHRRRQAAGQGPLRGSRTELPSAGGSDSRQNGWRRPPRATESSPPSSTATRVTW